jgi:molybdopterin molybdotransferase
VGDFDFTAQFLDGLGFERHCGAVNVRPGKPLIFASDGERLAFGLPGNPVSHFVCFHLFVARALARLGGRAPVGFRTARLGSEIPGRPSPRVTCWPARLRCDAEATVADPVAWNGSGHLASLLGVDALIRLAANDGLPKAGETVQILAVA